LNGQSPITQSDEVPIQKALEKPPL
jgi:hypothetical protein